jgi:hypothetical protein
MPRALTVHVPADQADRVEVAQLLQPQAGRLDRLAQARLGVAALVPDRPVELAHRGRERGTHQHDRAAGRTRSAIPRSAPTWSGMCSRTLYATAALCTGSASSAGRNSWRVVITSWPANLAESPSNRDSSPSVAVNWVTVDAHSSA